MGSVMVGVDIGQKRDPTAICVAEEDKREVGDRTESHFLIRHLERLALGTPYPEVADRVAQVVGAVKEHSSTLWLYLDATGVGKPIVDLVASRGLGTTPTAVYFTYGDRRIEKKRWEVLLGKAYLVSRLQMLLQSRRIHLPRTDEAERLSQELLDYEIRIDENANDRYGAFRVGTHDDLVTALGLAVQIDPKVTRVTWGRPLYRW